MTILVTGATGQLGGLTVDALLAAGTPADQVVATGRDVAKLEPLAARGVVTRFADFADPSSLGAAFAGATRMLLVSTTTPGERDANHRRAIDAAKAAGVTRIVYTSTLDAGAGRTVLGKEHSLTEEYLRQAGVAWVILRNGAYLENYALQVPSARQHGVLLGSAGHGRVSAAARADYAAAAVTVLTEDGHEGIVYELGGEAFTLTELAATFTEELGRPVAYHDLPVEEYAQILIGAGLPRDWAHPVADGDVGIRRGELNSTSDALVRLIGRLPTTRAEAVRAALLTSAG